MSVTIMIRNAIKASGLKISAIMEALEIKSYTTMRDKINNPGKFTINELRILTELLNLSTEQRDLFFRTIKTEIDSVGA